ncbi:50S ribosomal protein L33 [Mycoplasmopsis maculosa]|uniref:50S ribosomal protein L33 n=1 Tax=Mycoplasmopsis maculosa TaxID=114885 RepID=UPI00101B9859|nr:50S ribosomal protein L33 [Mycoplasmopsis maculosa]
MLKRKVSLCCEQCQSMNYTTNKSMASISNRIIIKKYCPKCKEHTQHKEEK